MKETASVKALLTGLNYHFFFVGEMAKMSLNASELFLLFMFCTKTEQDKRQKEERSADLGNANFCPLALIPLASLLPVDRLAKSAASPHFFRPVLLFTQLEVAFLNQNSQQRHSRDNW